MSAVIVVLFFLLTLLFCATLVACIRPSILHMKTRKEAAQAAAGCFVVLLVLTPFLPEKTAPENTTTVTTQPDTEADDAPVCEDIPGRIKRLECEYRRALQAWRTSSIELVMAHHDYLKTACPPCQEAMQSCTDDWYTHKQEKKFDTIPTAEYNRCMDRAWPKALWPRHTALPAPKMPPELSAHYATAVAQHKEEQRILSGPMTPEIRNHLRQDRPIHRPPGTDPSWTNSDTATLCSRFNDAVRACAGSGTFACTPENVALRIAEETLKPRPYGIYITSADHIIPLAHWMAQQC